MCTMLKEGQSDEYGLLQNTSSIINSLLTKTPDNSLFLLVVLCEVGSVFREVKVFALALLEFLLWLANGIRINRF